MFWNLLVWAALLYFGWQIWRRSRRDRFAWLLVISSGILVLLACSVIRTQPSHAPLRTVTGLAINRSHTILSRSSDFILIETGSGSRILFHTIVDGPWEDQPVRVTYLDDGSRIASVVRIEVVGEDQFPRWRVTANHVGWIGTTEPRRKVPLLMQLTGWLLVLIGIVMSPMPTKNNAEGSPV